MIAELLTAWRAEGLPIFHIRHNSAEPRSPYRPDGGRHGFKPQARPLAGETVIGKSTNSAFVDTPLEAALDEIGATTLVVCGVLTNNSVEATVRHGGNLGYRIFVVADACWAVDLPNREGQAWPAEIVHRLALACLDGEYGEVVDSAAALAAARQAKARQRRKKPGA